MSEPLTILPPTCPFAASHRARHSVQLHGLCSIEGGADEPCKATELAIDLVSVECAACVDLGDKVMFSFAEFGLVEATVANIVGRGFEARFDMATDSKLALYLAWLQGLPQADDDGERSAPRIVPVKKVATLGLEGEPDCMARIVDLSRSGVSVTTSKDLVPDQPIMVGPRPGHVVRVFDGGAAVAFDEPIAERDFDPLIELRAPA